MSRPRARGLGVSRTWFYRLRARLERYGPDGLHPKRRLARRGRPSLVSVVVERQVVAKALAWPTRGPQWVSDQLACDGVWVRPGHGVAGLASPRVEHGERAAGGAGAAQCRHEGNLDRADRGGAVNRSGMFRRAGPASWCRWIRSMWASSRASGRSGS